MDPDNKEYDFIGRVNDTGDGLIIYHSKMLRRVIDRLKDGDVEFVVRPYREHRTAAQNRYMHGVIVPTVKRFFQESSGHKFTNHEIYCWLKVTFNDEKPEVKTLMGREVIVTNVKTPSEMDTKEFAELVDKIIMGMAEKGCEIPEPAGNNHLHEIVKAQNDRWKSQGTRG